ncbi:unnamed protein product, partial [Rotaria sp. Silwood1]
MEITGFTDDNIERYAKQFFDQIKNKIKNASYEGEKLLRFLKSNPSIWGIAHIPVNLELICTFWGDTDWVETKTLTMTELYDNITEILCRYYLRKQNINHRLMSRKEVYARCHKELQFLECLAFNAMETNDIIVSPTLIQKTLKETDCSLANHPQLLNIGVLRSYDHKPT